MPEPTHQQLLQAAAKAPTTAEAAGYLAQADALRVKAVNQHAAGREVDMANAVIQDHLTPARVHEHHTAATDWIGSIDTTGGSGVADEMVAQASLWYGKVAAIKPWRDEFEEQARGFARRLAGAYGEQAPAAEDAFLRHAASLYTRELAAGIFVEAASGLGQVGDEGMPVADATVGPAAATGLPGDQTSSERAPQIQALENNGSSGIHDALGPNNAEADNGGQDRMKTQGSIRRESSMPQATCPSCKGRGHVAVRTEAASGLPQIQEVTDANNQPHAEQQPDWDVMFPWEMPPDSRQSINEAEGQIADREKLKGASRQRRAEAVAQEVYRRVLAGQDDSGWLGDMGSGGVGPGEQDGGNPGPYTNLGQPDPVYGFGGDQGDRAIKPYGADEADDITNKPAMWAPGQDTHADVGGRGMSTASLDQDPQIQKALAYVRNRRAYLSGPR